MSPVRITFRRTVGQARNSYRMVMVGATFLAAAMASFAFRLGVAEGESWTVASLWAVAVSPLMPFLAALVGMDSWSEERRTGRMEALLASPVSEGDLVLGKFLGNWFVVMALATVSLAAAIVLLQMLAPSVGHSGHGLAAAWLAIAVQSALWCAVTSAASALTGSSAIAAMVSVVMTVAVPRGVWSALIAWAPNGSEHFGEMPVDAHTADLATGVISSGTVVGYLMLSGLMLYVAVVAVSGFRLAGSGSRIRRNLARGSVVLFSIFTVMAIMLAQRLDATLELSVGGEKGCSERTLGILSEVRGELSATCFMPRSGTAFRSTARVLRNLSNAALAHDGVRIRLSFVDPSWDVGAAMRLVRSGVNPGSVVFSAGRRRAVIGDVRGLDERACASAILGVVSPPRHREIRWTCGHGEAAFDDYGKCGMSDVARELAQDGYLNRRIRLYGEETIPSDCAMIVVAGAREPFSQVETARIDAYLKQGGRLLVLLGGDGGGIASLLAQWGIVEAGRASVKRTLSGHDVVVTDFANHPVAAPMKGSSIVLDNPVTMVRSGAIGADNAADKIEFTALAKSGDDCVVAASERGSGVGTDLAVRPTRIIVVGDATFAMNGMLKARANANCDFMLNAVSYLSGTGMMTPGDSCHGVLVTGMDRADRRRLLIAGALVVPALVFICMFAVAYHRRHRS